MFHEESNEFTHEKPIELPRTAKAPSNIEYFLPRRTIHDQNLTLNASTHEDKVIIKTYRFIEDFERERQAHAILGAHTNIISPSDLFELGPLHCIVYPYKEGKNLEQHVEARVQENKRPISTLAAGGIFSLIGDALTHAHNKRITHNDVQPANIFIADTAYLLDWELATSIQGETLYEKPGAYLGREGFVAPEIIRGQPERTIATDVYAFGATLYYALSGKTPPTALLHLPVPALTDYGVQQSISKTIAKAMAKKPEHRFASIDEVMNAYEEAALHTEH